MLFRSVAIITAFTRNLKKQTQVPALQTVASPMTGGQPTFVFEYRQSNAPNNQLKRTDPFIFKFNDQRTKKQVVIEDPKKPDNSDNTPKVVNPTPLEENPPVIKVEDITNEFVGEVRGMYRKALVGYFMAVDQMSVNTPSSAMNAHSPLSETIKLCNDINLTIANKPTTIVNKPNIRINIDDERILEIKSNANRLALTAQRMIDRINNEKEFSDLNLTIQGVIAKQYGASCLINGTKGMIVLQKGDAVPVSRPGSMVVVSDIFEDFVVFDYKNFIKIKVNVGTK